MPEVRGVQGPREKRGGGICEVHSAVMSLDTVRGELLGCLRGSPTRRLTLSRGWEEGDGLPGSAPLRVTC